MPLRQLIAVLLTVGAVVGLGVRTAATDEPTDRASSCGAVSLEPEHLGDEQTRELTLCLLNEERAGHGLAPLQRRAQLELASQRHSEDMTARKFFEHDTPDGVDPQQRMLAADYPANNAITGENIAWGTGYRASPAEIVDSWMHSPGHRENILRAEFTEVGIGLVRGAPAEPRSRDTPWTYTTDFGGPPVR
jgi:uncharacterized protein YkwD